MRQIITAFIIVVGLIACQQEGRIYEEHQELSPKLEWLKKDKRIFKVPINDNSVAYVMSLSFRYTTGFEHQFVKVKVTEKGPDGKESVSEYDLKVREENGDYIGDLGYEIWDSEHVVESKKKFKEKGTYTYLIEQIMPQDPLNNVMEVGVILDKVK